MAIVLVVDDDPTIRTIAAELLREERHAIIEAADGDEALRVLDATHAELVVLDMLLPDTTGQAVFAALQADPLTRDVPVIGCSASAYAEDVSSALAQGLAAYLVKPLDVQQFLATLDRHLSPGSGDA